MVQPVPDIIGPCPTPAPLAFDRSGCTVSPGNVVPFETVTVALEVFDNRQAGHHAGVTLVGLGPHRRLVEDVVSPVLGTQVILPDVGFDDCDS